MFSYFKQCPLVLANFTIAEEMAL